MWVTLIFSFLESLVKNRAGQLILVGAVSWIWASSHTASYWKGIIAQEKAQIEAAYRAEIARQEEAAQEIAQAATERAETDAQAAASMKKVIVDYEKIMKEKRHVSANCIIDDDYSSQLRKLSDAGHRKTPVAPGPRKLRSGR